MANLSSLVVRVGADIADFTTDMGRAARIAEQRGDQMRAAFKKAGVAIGAAAVGAGAALTKMVSDTVREADRFQKLTDRIGGSVEAFSELEFVAERSGVKFETLTMGLQRMTRRIGEVAFAGKGEAKDALAALGLEAEKLAELPLDKQFEAIAEELSKVQNQSDRTRLAMKVFDSEGVALLQTMKGGAAGIQQLREEAQRLGVTISSETGQAAAEFSDNITDLTAGFDGLKRGISAEVIPAMNDLFESFVETGEGSDFASRAGEFLADTLRTLVGAGIVIKETFSAVARIVKGLGVVIWETLKAIAAPIQNFVGGTADALRALSEGEFKQAASAIKGIATDTAADFTASIGRMDAAIDEMVSGVGEDMLDLFNGVNKAFDENVKAGKGVQRQTQMTGREIKRTTDAVDQQTQEVEDLTGWYQKLISELVPAERATQTYLERVNKLNQALAAGDITQQQFERGITETVEAFNRATSGAEDTTSAIDEMTASSLQASQQVALNFSQMATDIVTNSLNKIDDAFSNIWRDLLDGAGVSFKGIIDAFKGMVAELLHTAITKPIVLRIGAMLGGVGGAGSAMAGQGGLLGSIFGGGGGGGGLFGGIGSLFSGGQIGNFFTNLPTWLGGTSSGGMNMAGGLFGNAQSYANWQYGIAGILGGLGGQALFGGQGGLGGSLGSTIGMAAFGPIGALIGGLLGGFVGGLFGDDDPDPRLQLVGSNVIGDPKLRGRTGPFTDSALGGFYITNANDLAGDVVSTVTDALKQFDQTIATFLNPRQLEEATLTLRDWGKEFEGEGITVAEILESRFKQLRYAFNYLGVFDYVDTFDNLEDQMEAFGRWFTAFNQLGAVVGEYLRTDPREAADALKQQAMTSTETLDSIGMSLRDAIGNFDNTPESLAQIAQLVQQRYQGEIEYLVAIDQLVQGISASIEDQQQRIREAVQGPRSFDEIIGEAQTLLASLATAGSPEEIGQIVGQIQSLVDSAFRGLDSDAQAMQADFLIGFLDQVQQAAEARANILAEQVLAEGAILREELGIFAEAINAPLDAQIAATQDVSASINNQTTALLDSDGETRAELRALREELARLSAAQQAAVDEQSVGRRFATS